MRTGVDPAALLALYDRALTRTGEIVAAVRDDQLGRPTPCTEWDVQALLGRLVEVNWWFAAAGGDPVSGDQRQSRHRHSWVEQYRRSAAAASAAFARPETAGRTFTLAVGAVPGDVALWIALATASVHGWDLATATGQNPTIEPGIAEPLLDFMTGFVTVELRRQPRRLFAPEVAASTDASPSDRLVAFLGRRP